MAKAAADRLFWRITGYSGTEQIFERVLPCGSMSDAEMASLLQRLASKGLSEDEILSASLRKKARGRTPFLEPRKDGGPGRRASISVGEDPHYIASVWRADELPKEEG